MTKITQIIALIVIGAIAGFLVGSVVQNRDHANEIAIKKKLIKHQEGALETLQLQLVKERAEKGDLAKMVKVLEWRGFKMNSRYYRMVAKEEGIPVDCPDKDGYETGISGIASVMYVGGKVSGQVMCSYWSRDQDR